MGDYEAKRIVILLGIIAGLYFLFTKADFNLHTGGDENYASYRTRASAWTLIGDASVTVNQGGGKLSGDQTIECPNCRRNINEPDALFCPYCGQRLK